ncbi:unnamed protein product [Sphagnum jensenii]|uniref:Uncharacterized protein n=2 Tax=Sphagnum jensenii TaxID=128206 RepID=A0ABP0VGC1_9BRYO
MQLYLNYDHIREHKLDAVTIRRDLVSYLLTLQGMSKVIDLHEVTTALLPLPYREMFVNGYNEKRSGDIQIYMTDIAATLAAMLHIQEPNGCIGKPIAGLAVSSCDRLTKGETKSTAPAPKKTIDIPIASLAIKADPVCGMGLKAGEIGQTGTGAYTLHRCQAAVRGLHIRPVCSRPVSQDGILPHDTGHRRGDTEQCDGDQRPGPQYGR